MKMPRFGLVRDAHNVIKLFCTQSPSVRVLMTYWSYVGLNPLSAEFIVKLDLPLPLTGKNM